MSPHPGSASRPSPVPPPAAPPGRGWRREGPPLLARSQIAAVKQAARELRREATRSERLLWDALRGSRLAGLKFRRQYPLGRFVLDFYCPAIRLAVEIDGDIHDTIQVADKERQTMLESIGIRFVRLPAELVESDLDAALAAIKQAGGFNPSPAPQAPTGEGSAEGRG